MNTRLLTGLVAAAMSLIPLVSYSQEPEHRQATREEKLAAALRLMAKDFNAALVSVDSDRQPRARTVEPFPPEDDWTIWVATNPLTRKVTQIEDSSKVTLYYNDDAAMAYVTIMGTATIHDDPESKARKKHRLLDLYWPNYPENYLLISVKPIWLEITTLEIPLDPKTWRPQAVRFDE
jgi:general stress protein 26